MAGKNEARYVAALRIDLQDLEESIFLKLPRIMKTMILKEG